MSGKEDITSTLTEAWAKLSAQWQGEAYKGFYERYVIKMMETVEDFEKACTELEAGATELLKKLQMIEHNIDNR